MRIFSSLCLAMVSTLLCSAFATASGELEPRVQKAKQPLSHLVAGETATGEIVVKFADEVKARAVAGQLESLGMPTKSFFRAQRLLESYPIAPAINQTQSRIDALIQRAESISGKMQPDLGGMIKVVAGGSAESLAHRLHALDCVDYVSIQTKLQPSSMFAGPTCDCNNDPASNPDCVNSGPGSCALPVTPPLCVEVSNHLECCNLGGVFSAGPCDESRAVIPLSVLTGPCSIPGAPQECQDLTSDECTAAGGAFFGQWLWNDVANNGNGVPEAGEIDANPDFVAVSCRDPLEDSPLTAGLRYPQYESTGPVTAPGGSLLACCLPPFNLCEDRRPYDCYSQGGYYQHFAAAEEFDLLPAPSGCQDPADPDEIFECPELGEDACRLLLNDPDDPLDYPAEIGLFDPTLPIQDADINLAGGPYGYPFFDCFYARPGTVFSPALGIPGAACNDGDCCRAVAEIEPACGTTGGSWDVGCREIARRLTDQCRTSGSATPPGPQIPGASGTKFFSEVPQPARGPDNDGTHLPGDYTIVTQVAEFDATCAQEWDMACAEYFRLFSYRLASRIAGESVDTPDLTHLQESLNTTGFKYGGRADYLQALSNGQLLPGEERFYAGIPGQTIPLEGDEYYYPGTGMALRGQPGEADTVVDDVLDDGTPITWGWFSPGEEFLDWGLDGEGPIFDLATLLALDPTYTNRIRDFAPSDWPDDPNTPNVMEQCGLDADGNIIDLTDAAPGIIRCEALNLRALVNDPQIPGLVINLYGPVVPNPDAPPNFIALNPYEGFVARGDNFENGECDGLFTPPSGGDGFVRELARDVENNGGSLFDFTGTINPDPTIDLGDELFRGRTARIAVIDFSYWQGHEDLDQVDEVNGVQIPRYQWKDAAGGAILPYQPRLPYVISEPGQTLITIPVLGHPDHGTAVLGLLSALDEERDWNTSGGAPVPAQGITGMVPEAQPYFFPLISRQEGNREQSAWFAALERLGPGDVICAPYEPTGAETCVIQKEEINDIAELANNLGIACVISAGNGRRSIDADAAANFDKSLQSYVIATATYMAAAHDQAGNPRMEDANYGESVDFHAWGDWVVSTGYGDLWSAINPDTYNDNGDGKEEEDEAVDRRRAYTAHFGGTSAAATQVAGAVCAIQGVAKQAYGIPAFIAGTEGGGLRDVAMKAYTQTEASGSNLENSDLPDANGSLNLSEDQPANTGLDILGIPVGWPLRIWEFGMDDVAVVQVVNLDDAVYVDEAQSLAAIYPIKGELQGNIFSVKGDDGIRLRMTSEFATGGESSNGGTFVGSSDLPSNADEVIRNARRILTGEVTDLLMLARTEQIPDTVDQVVLELQMQQPTTFASVVLLDLWNQRSRRWQLVAGAIIEGDEDEQGDIELELEAPMGFGRARQYINRDGYLWARAYTWSPGAGPFGGVPEYDLLIDRINLNFQTSGDDTP